MVPLPFVIFVGVMVAVLVFRLRAVSHGPAEVRRGLTERGYQIQRMEPRFFTKGVFPEMSGVAGMRGADRLYRLKTIDVSGTPRVAWVRIFKRWPGQPLKWEIRYDERPPGTGHGVGRAGFMAFLLAAGIPFLWLWYTLARSQGWFG